MASPIRSPSLPSLKIAGQRSARLDHLGKPLKHSHSRHKFGRTCTIAYNHANTPVHVKIWSLMVEARRAASFSMPALRRLHARFADSLDPGVILVGPNTFTLVLNAEGLTDRVLVGRLFSVFAELSGDVNVEYRELLRAFACVDAAPIEEKIDLLFSIYDTEGAATLTLPELTEVIAKTTRPEVLHAATRPNGARDAVAGAPSATPSNSSIDNSKRTVRENAPVPVPGCLCSPPPSLANDAAPSPPFPPAYALSERPMCRVALTLRGARTASRSHRVALAPRRARTASRAHHVALSPSAPPPRPLLTPHIVGALLSPSPPSLHCACPHTTSVHYTSSYLLMPRRLTIAGRSIRKQSRCSRRCGRMPGRCRA